MKLETDDTGRVKESERFGRIILLKTDLGRINNKKPSGRLLPGRKDIQIIRWLNPNPGSFVRR